MRVNFSNNRILRIDIAQKLIISKYATMPNMNSIGHDLSVLLIGQCLDIIRNFLSITNLQLVFPRPNIIFTVFGIMRFYADFGIYVVGIWDLRGTYLIRVKTDFSLI